MRRSILFTALLTAGTLVTAGLVSVQTTAAPEPWNAAWSPGHVGTLDAATEKVLHAVFPFVSAPDAAAPVSQWSLGGVGLASDAAARSRAVTASIGVARSKGRVESTLGSGALNMNGQGLIPFEQFKDYSLTTDTTAEVDLGNGNLILKSIDGSLNSAGVGLSNSRYWNSLGTYAGSLGGDWLSPLSGFDVGLYVGTSHAYFAAPSGNIESFTLDGSSWDAPSQFRATLTTGSSSSTLTYNSSGEKLTFNGSGWLTSDVNANGLGNTYAYNSAGQVTQVTESAGRSYTVNWTTVGSSSVISSIVDSGGRTTTYSHNSAGQLTEVDSPGSYWEKYSYDGNGRVSEIQAVGPDTSTNVLVDFSYDSSGRVAAIKQGTVGSGSYARTTTFSGWGASSTLSVTDGNGHVTQWAINAYNIPKGETDANGNTTSWTHDAWGNINSYTDANGNKTTYTFDSNNNLTSASAPTGATSTATYATSSGCTGTGGTAYQAKCTTDASSDTTAYTYDASGNATATTDTTAGGTGDATASTYATASGGCYTTGSGSTLVVHGLAGQLCSSTTGTGATTTYQYDGSGNQTKVVPPSPLGSTSYTYDALGRVTSMTDGNGKTTSYTYNVRDELLTTTYAGGTSLTETWTPNGLEATSSQDSSNKVAYTYDVLGQTLTQRNTASAIGFPETYTYDTAGNLTSYTDQYGTVSYVYNPGNQLTELIEPSGSCTSSGAPAAGSGCIKFSYDVNGNETLRQYPGGAQIATTRDATGRDTRITAKDASGSTVFDKGYSYSLAGTDTMDVQTATSYVETGIPASAVTSYGYDTQDRLTSAVEKNSSGATTASWTYSYDADGNRTKQVLTGSTGTATGAPAAGTTTYSYNSADQLTSTSADTSTWSYDADGNQLKNGITAATTSYNDHGGVTSTTTGSDTATYSTYGTGNTDTTSRTDAGTTTNYRQSDSLGLTGEDYGNQRIYDVTPAGSPVGSRLAGGSRYYFIQDDLDSVVGIFDINGNYYGGYTYGPYGEPRYTSSNSALTNNHLRYISGYYDTSTGLYKLGARYYDTTTGRFTQEDPSGQEANPYSYAEQNPIAYSDPLGELSSSTIDWIANVGIAALLALTCSDIFSCAVMGYLYTYMWNFLYHLIYGMYNKHMSFWRAANYASGWIHNHALRMAVDAAENLIKSWVVKLVGRLL